MHHEHSDTPVVGDAVLTPSEHCYGPCGGSALEVPVVSEGPINVFGVTLTKACFEAKNLESSTRR
jgi:hypothetical protein